MSIEHAKYHIICLSRINPYNIGRDIVSASGTQRVINEVLGKELVSAIGRPSPESVLHQLCQVGFMEVLVNAITSIQHIDFVLRATNERADFCLRYIWRGYYLRNICIAERPRNAYSTIDSSPNNLCSLRSNASTFHRIIHFMILR